MEKCAKVLFYDSGYKSVKGLSKTNIAEWTKSLENAYENGSDTRPFRSQKKGRISVVDKVEMLEPGLVRKHYKYAEKTIGNQASFDALACTMTKKAYGRLKARHLPMELQSDTTRLQSSVGSSCRVARTSHQKRSLF